ncbi:MAG: biopolymer transporter ExbD [Verrucomicrobia bacterium]|nr:biopolymer transporter ExbD [Verrucomicrobiota bacterium]MDA1064904.1 biopolymer transporter ExbD [Verrucomicrobiota bacterium]
MKNRKSLSGGDDTSQINISPMIDMVFILLIFFIVTTVFVEESGFAVDRPNPVAEPEEQDEEKESVKLSVDKNNQIFYNGEKIDRGSIRPKVSQVLQANKEAPVVVEAQDAALAGLVVMVMDEARLGGAEVISLTSAPD